MRVQHGLLLAYERLFSVSGISLATVCVPLGPLKNHTNGVLLGGLPGHPIVLPWPRLRR